MDIPVNTIGGTGALRDAERKHHGLILALVCLALGLIVAMLTLTPQAIGAGMDSGESWFVGP
jgi:hypothetical protein